MITTQNRLAAANIATSNLKSGTDFSIAAIMARDELSRESSEFSISKLCFNFKLLESQIIIFHKSSLHLLRISFFITKKKEQLKIS